MDAWELISLGKAIMETPILPHYRDDNDDVTPPLTVVSSDVDHRIMEVIAEVTQMKAAIGRLGMMDSDKLTMDDLDGLHLATTCLYRATKNLGRAIMEQRCGQTKLKGVAS